RTPFYEKELALHFARSYGPGRYERSYEEYGVDYPAGHVRWTQGRNLEAFLDLLASGRLAVADLVTQSFGIADAPRAYELLATRSEPSIAVRLSYPEVPTADGPLLLRTPQPGLGAGIGWLGAGAFTAGTLLPAFRAAGFRRFTAIASAQGLTARRLAEQHGFERAVSSAEDVIGDPDVGTVVIATPHESHADLVVRALEAGKNVWCEKPPALTAEDLDRIIRAHQTAPGVLFVGYNRRWSPALRVAADYVRDAGPATVVYRVAAGILPGTHWYHDRRQGGRLRGEVCHFVDACCALTGSPAAAVSALAGDCGELGLAGEVGIVIRHASGAVSTIAYGTAAPARAGKERVEVLAGSRHAVIDDYRKVTADGTRRWSGAQDKGHHSAVAAFMAALRDGGDRGLTAELLDSTRTTLAALAAAQRQVADSVTAAGRELR
ncbi:MAG: hypothetical protein QOD41_51, partial [Cryptosporangiaceae bacterium]|nr:hypothetical protein [Cryptosporangiaceae bacterium]